MEFQGLISVNGQVSRPEAARISPLDRGFLFADAIFETIVSFHGQLLDAPRHLARLRESAEAVGMVVPWTDAELSFELAALAEAVGAPKASLRFVVTRGEGMGLRVAKDMRPNRVAYCLPAGTEPKATYEEGLALKRLVKSGATRGAAPKTANYQQSVVAIDRAQQEGFQDILWTNAEGEIGESSIANVFFLARQGDLVEIVTPPAASGILLGITREKLLSLLNGAKIPAREQIVFADELPRFDEAFLCSTVRGLVPVSRIDKQKLFTTRPTATYRHIERLYFAWVESQLGFRVDWPTGNKL